MSLSDLWRRLFPGSPRIDQLAVYPTQGSLPDDLDRHELALVGSSFGAAKWAVFECPCGTGHRIMVPLNHRTGSSWRVSTTAGRPSLRPSVDSLDDGRRCHFWLRDGRVYWSPSRRRGRHAPRR
jgi:hypothetical protein